LPNNDTSNHKDIQKESVHASEKDFPLSENVKSLGILRIAIEYNTIVIEINSSINGEPLLIRKAIDFKDWNRFMDAVKRNLSDSLRSDTVEKKRINLIIANVETILNRNFEAIRTPVDIRSAHCNTPEALENSTNNIRNKASDTKCGPTSFLTINQLVKKQTGTFQTKGAVTSITPIMHAIIKLQWKCPAGDRFNENGNPYCDYPFNEVIFNPPLLRLDGLKLRCSSCSSIAPAINESTMLKEWINYVIIQVQDDYDGDDYNGVTNTLASDELQKITTIVYDEYVDNVHIGESIKIYGRINVPLKSYDKPYSGRTINSNLSSVLYADSVIYERREDVKITDNDITAFRKFVTYPNLVDRLAAMFAPNVVGHEDKKIAVVLAAVSALRAFNKNDKKEKQKTSRDRIHVLFVGTPGTAKTTLSYESINLLPNSRFTAAQTSSAKTILAIVEVQGDVKVIRYGAIPLAKKCNLRDR